MIDRIDSMQLLKKFTHALVHVRTLAVKVLEPLDFCNIEVAVLLKKRAA